MRVVFLTTSLGETCDWRYVNQQIAIVGYGLAGTGFAVLAVLMLTSWRDRTRGSLLPLSALVTALWGAMLAYAGAHNGASEFDLFLYETVHDLAWLAFLSSLLSGAVSVGSNRIIRYGGVAFACRTVVGWLARPSDEAFPGDRRHTRAITDSRIGRHVPVSH